MVVAAGEKRKGVSDQTNGKERARDDERENGEGGSAAFALPQRVTRHRRQLGTRMRADAGKKEKQC